MTGWAVRWAWLCDLACAGRLAVPARSLRSPVSVSRIFLEPIMLTKRVWKYLEELWEDYEETAADPAAIAEHMRSLRLMQTRWYSLDG